MSTFVFVTPTWDAGPWARSMREVTPGVDVRIWPDCGNADDVDYVAAWLPPPNVVRSFPHLKVIFSLGAGVDAILSDPTLPAGVPIVRVNDPDLTNRMSEYVVLHCLMHLRQQRRLDGLQQQKKWQSIEQPAAAAMTVGVMGLGVLGQDAVRKLAMMGFGVRGWSRSPRNLDGIAYFSGSEGLEEFLAGTDILVCLLPATDETDGIINRSLIGKLSRKGPFGAPILINAGRGRQNNEDDILACLDSGQLHAATLDVFRKEPLPENSALWTHPRLTVTPHIAADSDPATICRYVAAQIARFEAGQALINVVDRAKGY